MVLVLVLVTIGTSTGSITLAVTARAKVGVTSVGRHSYGYLWKNMACESQFQWSCDSVF